jgi:hypothetical protein
VRKKKADGTLRWKTDFPFRKAINILPDAVTTAYVSTHKSCDICSAQDYASESYQELSIFQAHHDSLLSLSLSLEITPLLMGLCITAPFHHVCRPQTLLPRYPDVVKTHRRKLDPLTYFREYNAGILTSAEEPNQSTGSRT